MISKKDDYFEATLFQSYVLGVQNLKLKYIYKDEEDNIFGVYLNNILITYVKINRKKWTEEIYWKSTIYKNFWKFDTNSFLKENKE